MKKALLILLFIISFISACKKSPVEINDKPIDKPVVIKPAKIELTFERAVIKANGVEQTTLSTKVTDATGNVMNEVCAITMNGSVFTGTSFKTSVHGDYTFQASIGTLLSNSFIVKATENLDGKPYKIELSIDKSTIKGNNIETANLKTKVTDVNGAELSDNIKLTANGITIIGTAFKTSVHGDYVFQASIGNVISNSVNLKVNENLDGKPFKIELTTDKSIISSSSFIAAYNIEEAKLQAKVTDINGTILTDNPTFTLNGNPFIGTSFKTGTPGDYVFQALIGSVKSNTHTIYAEERAEKYVTITKSLIEKINSAGLVQIGIQFKNISNKRLKYIAFSVSCYNSVNDLMREEITGRTTYTFNATGFWEPGIERYPSYEIGYYTGAKSIKTTLYSVTLEDGTVIKASN